MKKDLIKGIIIGSCLTLVIALSVPVIAQTADVSIEFNLFRIRTPDKTIVDWGQPYTTDDWREVPASIVYNDETYLHIDLINEAYSKTYGENSVLWNGDSSTYTLMDSANNNNIALQTAMNEPLDDRWTITRNDSEGNSWTYRVVWIDRPEIDGEQNNKDTYLIIEDKTRGYTRAYKLASERAFVFTDDGVWFASEIIWSATEIIWPGSPKQYNYCNELTLIKINYDNNPDSQDGTAYPLVNVTPKSRIATDNVMITDGVLYFIYMSGESYIIAVPCEDNGLSKYVQSPWEHCLPTYTGATRLIEVKDGYLYYEYGYSYQGATTRTEYKVKIDGTEKAIKLEETTIENDW